MKWTGRRTLNLWPGFDSTAGHGQSDSFILIITALQVDRWVRLPEDTRGRWNAVIRMLHCAVFQGQGSLASTRLQERKPRRRRRRERRGAGSHSHGRLTPRRDCTSSCQPHELPLSATRLVHRRWIFYTVYNWVFNASYISICLDPWPAWPHVHEGDTRSDGQSPHTWHLLSRGHQLFSLHMHCCKFNLKLPIVFTLT